MVKVLVIGATGYIGSALCASLLRSGHYAVYGVARSTSKARTLAAAEVIPVLAEDPVHSPQPILDIIRLAHIDVVVSCGADQEAQGVLKNIIEAGKQRLQENENAGIHNVKLGFVYTSGTWVHGSSSAPVTDLEPVGTKKSRTQPPRLVSWRPAIERDVLAVKNVLDTMIVRPGLVYGRGHAIWSSFFHPVMKAAKESSSSAVRIPLNHNARPGLVHVDDVASGLHAAIDKLPLFAGIGVYPVFDLIGHTENMQEVFDALARTMGFKGKVELVSAGDSAFSKAMSTSGNVSSERAKQLLDWIPRRVSFVDGMDVYGAAFVAAQEAESKL